ncbi:MAG: polymerase sigma-70 factor, subfamily [Blastocatellia bacterium]|jgi:RNA polymerase sigma-70 factor (ECF subfamily)|nr:polymerase sigma-70 factor, subfamily [Blastocatellia bacterium]
MPVSTTPSDGELLRLVSAGDEEAFVTLYRQRHGGVYRFALHMSGSQTIAEDVTQEVFMVLMRDSHGYDATRGSLAAYLYGIARNQVLRCLDRNRPFVPMADGEADDKACAIEERLVAQDDPLGELARNETIAAVRRAILALPSHYREVVVLCDLHEMSYNEAAEALSCAVGTVRSRLHRARALLVERLRATGGETDSASEPFKTAGCFA